MDKLVSVVIPTYDRKELTDRAIQSVATSYPDALEIIVVDDCSSVPFEFDGSENKYGVLVTTVRLPENGGAGMARKAGVNVAHGKYIAFLDSDDCYDKGWMDYIVTELKSIPMLQNHRLVISGITKGEKKLGGWVRKALAAAPRSMQLAAIRLITVLFNPIYTPSIVQSKDLCFFKNGLRYCEDYYSTAMALFQADKVVLPEVVACHLGRSPNSAGGLSSARDQMYQGEMEVRRSMLTSPILPLRYKILVPVGMLYQAVRNGIKRHASGSMFND